MISISCLESKLLNNNNWYGRFQLAPFQKGEGLTVANALRRTLLAEKSKFFITWVDFYNAEIPYSVLTGMRESIFDILLNLKQVIFTSDKTLPKNKIIPAGHLLQMSCENDPSNNNFKTQKIFFSKNKFNLEPKIHFSKKFEHGLNKTSNNSSIYGGNPKNQGSLPRDLIINGKTKNIFCQPSPRLTIQDFLVPKKTGCAKQWGENQNQILGKTMNSKNETFSLVPVGIFPKNSNGTGQYLDTDNLKEKDNSTYLGYICAKGPATIYAKNIKLPKGLKCVDPNKYIVTLADDGLFYLRFELTTEIETLPFNDASNTYLNIDKSIKFNNVRLKTFPKTLFNKEIQSLFSYRRNPPMKNLQNKSKKYHNSKIHLISTKPVYLGLNLAKQTDPRFFFKSNSTIGNEKKIHFQSSSIESDDLKMRPVNHTKNLINQQRLILTNDSMKQLNFQNTSITANIQKTCLLNIQVKHYYYKCGRFDRFLFDLIKPFKPSLKSIHYNKFFFKSNFFQDSDWKILTYLKKTLLHQKNNTVLPASQSLINYKQNNFTRSVFKNYFSKNQYFGSLVKWQKLFQCMKRPGRKTSSIYDYFHKLQISEAAFFQLTKPSFPAGPFKNKISLVSFKVPPRNNISNIGAQIGSSMNNENSHLWRFDLYEPYIQKFLNLCFSFQYSRTNILYFLKFSSLQYNNSFFNSQIKLDLRERPFIYNEKLITNIKFLRQCLYLTIEQSKETKILLSKKKSYLFPLSNRLFLVGQINLLEFFSLNESKLLKAPTSNYDHHFREFFDSGQATPRQQFQGGIGCHFTPEFTCSKKNKMCEAMGWNSTKEILFFKKPFLKEETNKSLPISTNVRIKPFSSIQQVSYKPIWMFPYQFKQSIDNLSRWLKNFHFGNIKQAQTNKKFFWNSSCFTREVIKTPFKTKINNSVILKPIYLNIELIIYILKQTTKFRKNQRINPVFFNSFNNSNFYPLDNSLLFSKVLDPFQKSLNDTGLFNNIQQTKRLDFLNNNLGSFSRAMYKKNKSVLPCHVWVLGNHFVFKSNFSNSNLNSAEQLKSIASIWTGGRFLKNRNGFVFCNPPPTQKNREMFINQALRLFLAFNRIGPQFGFTPINFVPKQTKCDEAMGCNPTLKKHFIINRYFSLLDVNYKSNIKHVSNQPYNINIYHSKISFNLRYNHPFKYTIFETCLPFLNSFEKVWDLPKINLDFSASNGLKFFEKPNAFVFKIMAFNKKTNNKKNVKLDNVIKNSNSFPAGLLRNQHFEKIKVAPVRKKNYQIINNHQKDTKVLNSKIISYQHFDYIQYNESFKIYTTLAYTCLKTYEPQLSKHLVNRPNQKKSSGSACRFTPVNFVPKSTKCVSFVPKPTKCGKAMDWNPKISSQCFESLIEPWAFIQNKESYIFDTKLFPNLYSKKPSVDEFFNLPNQLPSIFNHSSKWRIMNRSNLNDAFIVIPCNWSLDFKSTRVLENSENRAGFFVFGKWQRCLESNHNKKRMLYVLPNLTSLFYPQKRLSFLPPLQKLFYMNSVAACNPFENNLDTLFFDENTGIIKNKLHWLKVFQTNSVDSAGKNYDENNNNNDYSKKSSFLISKFKMKKSLKKLAISFENIYYKNFLWNSRKITLRILNSAVLPLVTDRKYTIYDFVPKKNFQALPVVSLQSILFQNQQNVSVLFQNQQNVAKQWGGTQKLPFYSVRHKILGTTNFLCSESYPTPPESDGEGNQNEIQAFKADGLIRVPRLSLFQNKLSNPRISLIDYDKMQRQPLKAYNQQTQALNTYAQKNEEYLPFSINKWQIQQFNHFTTRNKRNENSKSNSLFDNQGIGSQIFIDDPYTPEKLTSLRKNRWIQTLIHGSTSSSSKHAYNHDSKIKSPLIHNLWSSSFFCSHSLYAISTKSDLFLQNLISLSGLTDQNLDASIFSQAPLFVPLEAQQKGATPPKTIERSRLVTSASLNPVSEQINRFKTASKADKNTLEEAFFPEERNGQGKMLSNSEQSNIDKFLNVKPFHVGTTLKSLYDKTVQKILKFQHHKSMDPFVSNYDFHWQKAVYFAILRQFKRPKLNNPYHIVPTGKKIRFNSYKNQYNDQFFLQYPQKNIDYNSKNLINVLKNKHSIRRLKKYERYFGNPLRRRINQKGLSVYTIRSLTKLAEEFKTLKKNQQIIKSWKSIIWTANVYIYFVFSYPLFIQNCNLPWQKSKYIFYITKDWLHGINVTIKPLYKFTRSRRSDMVRVLSKSKTLTISLPPEELNTNLFMTYTQLSSSSNKSHQPLLNTKGPAGKLFKNLRLPVHMHIQNKGSYEMISYFTIKESLNSTYKVNYIVESQASQLKSMSELAFHSNQNHRVTRFTSSIKAFHNMKKFENIQSDSGATDSLTVSNFLNGTYSFVPSKTIILNSKAPPENYELINSKINNSQMEDDNEYIQIDIWTNGALSPRQALLNAFKKLFELFYNLSKYNCLKPIEI